MIKLLLKLEREIKKWRKRCIENKQERLVILKYDMAIKARKIDHIVTGKQIGRAHV